MQRPTPRRPWTLAAAATALLGVLAVVRFPPLRVEAAWTGLIRDDDPASAAQARLREHFSAGEMLVVVCEGEPPAAARTAQDVARAAAAWPEVVSVVGPRDRAAPPGTLSADGRRAAVYVGLGPRHAGGASARAVMERLPALPHPEAVHLSAAGGVIEDVEMARTTERDVLRIVPAVFVALILAGWLLLRSSVGAGALAAVIALVLVLTLATHGLLYGSPTTVTILVVPIVMTVAAANAVHFAARYRRDLRRLPPEPAMRLTLRRGGAACLVASLTTGFGFLALLVLRIPDFTRLAVLGAAGCVWTWLVIVGVMPALLARFPHRLRPLRDGRGRLARAAVLDLAHRGPLAWAIVVALLLMAAGASRLSSTTRTLDLVPDSAEVHEVSRVLDTDLGGSAYVEVLWSSPSSFRSADGLARIRKAAGTLQAQVPRTCMVASAAGAVDAARAVLPALSDTALLAAYESGVGGKLPRWIDASGHEARLTVRLPSGTTRDLLDAADAARESMGRVTAPRDAVDVAGAPLLIARALEDVVSGQALASLLSVALVSLLAMIVLRSWRVLPVIWAANLLPLAALAGLLGWTEQPISVSTAVVGSVVFGLVVDDTLHFLFAMREVRPGPRQALRALARLAPAFVATTLILFVGAAVSSFGTTPAVTIFSRLMAVGVLLALFCDLFVGPRVAARLCRSGRGRIAPRPAHGVPQEVR